MTDAVVSGKPFRRRSRTRVPFVCITFFLLSVSRVVGFQHLISLLPSVSRCFVGLDSFHSVSFVFAAVYFQRVAFGDR